MRGRRWTQIIATLAANPWFAYFSSRTIYQGKVKGICFPGFNCHACPLALFACPIGSLQHSLALISPQRHSVSAAGYRTFAMIGQRSSPFPVGALLYVIGLLGIIGAATGRLVCGWVCPFGFLQDLLYKIPTPKLRLPGFFRFGKYLTLLVLAMFIPYLTGVNWFSRLCPAGALEGLVPLRILPPKTGLPPMGWFQWVKIGILVTFLLWMVVTKRPFCRAACPLGAIYSLFNPVSLYRMQVDESKCTYCYKCHDVCPVDVDILDDANSPECIRCLDCKKECPTGAITSGFRFKREKSKETLAPRSINTVTYREH